MQRFFGKRIISIALPFLILIVPIFQLFLSVYGYRALIERAPEGTAFHKAAWRENYITFIRQGYTGDWSMSIPYSTTPPPSVPGGHLFFIILGHIARIGNIDPVTIMDISQLVMGVFLFYITLWGLKMLLPKTLAYIAYLFAMCVETGIYIRTMVLDQLSWDPSYVWQQKLVERHFGYPHHTFGKAIGVLFVIFFWKSYQSPTLKNIIPLCILGCIGGFILPPFFVVLFLVVLFPLSIILLFQKKLIRKLPIFIISGLSVVIPMLLLHLSFSVVPSLANFTETEKTWWTNSEVLLRYLSSLMLYIPWLILGCIAWIKLRRTASGHVQLMIFLSLCWVIGPFILVPLTAFKWFPIANARITDGYQYLPAGIISAYGALWALRSANRKIRIGARLLLIGTIFISILFTIILTRNHILKRSIAWANIYPTHEYWQAIDYLKTLPKNSGIITSQLIAEIIPAYTDLHVYAGSPGLTWPHYDDRIVQMKYFFSGNMEEKEARQFLFDNNIDYIFMGYDELNLAQTPTLYPHLIELLYSNQSVSIYTYNKNETLPSE